MSCKQCDHITIIDSFDYEGEDGEVVFNKKWERFQVCVDSRHLDINYCPSCGMMLSDDSEEEKNTGTKPVQPN